MKECTNALDDFSVVGLPATQLGTVLEDRVNSFLHNNGIATGEITIRMVSNTDKILDTRSGVKNRSVIIICMFVCVSVCVYMHLSVCLSDLFGLKITYAISVVKVWK